MLFLFAAVAAVPLASRLGIGAVLGLQEPLMEGSDFYSQECCFSSRRWLRCRWHRGWVLVQCW
ncbi:hypothetical protein, partial [Escherichia coli]|uniref:hypothetical protein n=1 Tax=Escherichia coli TaxID=562 RepID=UPI001BC881D0